ncbi:MAG: MalY/PatB family protein [Clostridia bacterium]
MNFNKEINRYNTKSLKYDFKEEKGKPDDIFPMWVADMDFKLPENILNEIKKRVDHGIFGYSKPDDTYKELVKNWYKKHFSINIKKEWIVNTPGIVFALATAVKTLTKENDYVLINNPVYYPFSEVIENNNRKIISSDLVLTEKYHYEIDFKDLEEKIKKYKVKLYLLCSPHNPVGRVWSKEELSKIIKICKEHNVFIVCDEIHSDFVWQGTHTSLINYKEYQNNMIVCTAPSKTFNIAGLQVSNIFIPDNKIREMFQKEMCKTGYSLINTMGIVACEIVYKNGEEWLNELKEYLIENINLVREFLKEKLPNVKLIEPEGTYLLWLDFRETGLTDEEIEDKMSNEAKIWLDGGNMFGKPGERFQRINIALPREKLKLALNQIEKAFR